MIIEPINSLWREDGEEFVMKHSGKYAMRRSMMFKPQEYSYEELMDTGEFSVYKPNTLTNQGEGDNLKGHEHQS